MATLASSGRASSVNKRLPFCTFCPSFTWIAVTTLVVWALAAGSAYALDAQHNSTNALAQAQRYFDAIVAGENGAALTKELNTETQTVTLTATATVATPTTASAARPETPARIFARRDWREIFMRSGFLEWKTDDQAVTASALVASGAGLRMR